MHEVLQEKKEKKWKAQDIFLSEWSCLKMMPAWFDYEKKLKKTDRLMAGSHIRIFFYLLDANDESR